MTNANAIETRDERYARTWGSPIGQDCISLDISLCKWLGERMIFLAEHTNSYHPDYTYESWAGNLTQHGYALLAYHDHWNDHDDDKPTVDYHLKAQAAMLFVAANLGHFWD